LPSDGSSNPEREQRIFDAAAELFAHYGYAKTTIDDIAASAGVSKGAVYLHFRSKDELLDRLIIRESERLIDDLMKRLEHDPQGITLFTLYRHSMVAANENPLIRAIYLQDRRVLGDYLRRAEKTPVFQQRTMFGTEFIAHFQRAGLVRPEVNPETLAYVLMAIRHGFLTIEDYAPGTSQPPLEEIGELIGDMLQKSFGAEAGNSEEGKQALLNLFEQGREMLRQMRSVTTDKTE
jgi:TetR/AcrR family acrAB operon transcriptional repressor